jgi:hypothetical protein
MNELLPLENGYRKTCLAEITVPVPNGTSL